MPYFDRHDILAAWNLYLQNTHTGQGSKTYARLCQLQRSFKPGYREQDVKGLSDNAMEIYAALASPDAPEYPIANASEASWIDSLYLMWAGACAPTQVYVWAKSFDDAFETLVEWLDANAPGLLVSHEDAKQALEEYCQERHNMSYDALVTAIGNGDCTDYREEGEVCDAVEQANDWTSIGHTSLDNGGHIPSHEWGGGDVTDANEYERVLIASRLESAS